MTLGAGARVLGPVHFGKGAQIGAHAVVVRDVPEAAVAVGVPARVRCEAAHQPADNEDLAIWI